MEPNDHIATRIMGIVSIARGNPPQDDTGLARYMAAQEIDKKFLETLELSLFKKLKRMAELKRLTDEFYDTYPPSSS